MDAAVLTALFVEYLVGITLNMYILFVYIKNLKNGLSLGPSEKVHVTKALVNVFQLLTMKAQNIVYDFWLCSFFTNNFYLWITLTIMFLIIYSYWLTALLCVYYCTNIINSGHHSLIWLKRSLSSYLLHILIVLGIGSAAISLPVFWLCSISPATNSTDESPVIRGTVLQNVSYRITSTILGCFLPFSIALISTIFSSWSLINHMWRMKQNNRGFARSKFRTQINATKTMIWFLLISVIYNVTQMLFFTIPTSTPDVIVILIWFILISYPITEAIIIIRSNCKLRKTLLGKFFDRKRRNIQAET